MEGGYKDLRKVNRIKGIGGLLVVGGKRNVGMKGKRWKGRLGEGVVWDVMGWFRVYKSCKD